MYSGKFHRQSSREKEVRAEVGKPQIQTLSPPTAGPRDVAELLRFSDPVFLAVKWKYQPHDLTQPVQKKL